MMQDNSYYELAAKFHYSCDIGMAGYEVAAYFLRTSGQGHTVEVVRICLLEAKLEQRLPYYTYIRTYVHTYTI